jgi:hypothetical protein
MKASDTLKTKGLYTLAILQCIFIVRFELHRPAFADKHASCAEL